MPKRKTKSSRHSKGGSIMSYLSKKNIDILVDLASKHLITVNKDLSDSDTEKEIEQAVVNLLREKAQIIVEDAGKKSKTDSWRTDIINSGSSTISTQPPIGLYSKN